MDAQRVSSFYVAEIRTHLQPQKSSRVHNLEPEKSSRGNSFFLGSPSLPRSDSRTLLKMNLLRESRIDEAFLSAVITPIYQGSVLLRRRRLMNESN